MYLDASAIAAMLIPEPDAPVLEERLDNAQRPFFVSPVTVIEAILAVAKALRKRTDDPVSEDMLETAREMVSEYLAALSVVEIPVTPEIGLKAQKAMFTYGKAVRHPAQLNLGDCLAYACAKEHRIPLLYKGNDFSQTDLS